MDYQLGKRLKALYLIVKIMCYILIVLFGLPLVGIILFFHNTSKLDILFASLEEALKDLNEIRKS